MQQRYYSSRNIYPSIFHIGVDGGFVAFAGSPKGGKITGKGKIRTGKLDFEDVYFVKELKFNLFSVSQMCDKKNSVLFTETECLVLSPDFKLLDESQVLLKVPRQNNMYSFNLKNVVPSGGLTCLFAKATIDESNLWHRRLGHINFKTMNKLVRGNLVRGLPSKLFENDHTCVACQKGKQHKASCKTKLVSSISQPLQMLHMDLFGPTFVKSLNKKMYCLVVTDDFSSSVGMKRDIKEELVVARTPQQNGVAEKKNMKLIEVARTMLADSLLPTTFWAEVVSTTCYVYNRVLVTKPHNKTPYEQLHGRPPSISFMRHFGCPVTILNTLDPLGKFDGKADEGKFDGKADEGFYVGYSINIKAFRVFNTRTRKVEENLHITFLENKPNVAGSGPDWLFDIDLLTNSMNYEPVIAGNQTNKNAGNKDNGTQQYILLPLLYNSPQSSEDAVADDAGKKTNEEPANKGERNGQEKEGASNKEDDQNVQDFRAELDNLLVQQKEGYANSTNRDSTISPSVSTAGQNFTNADDLPTNPLIPDLEDTGIFIGAYDDEDVGAEADLNNLETTMNVSPILITRIYKNHPKDQIFRDINSSTQTRRMTKIFEEHAMDGLNWAFGIPGIHHLTWKLFSDSDYAGASLDRKSTIRGCQFLGKRLSSWQCKKQTIVANSTTEAEYVAVANCYRQVLWIQNQMLDYGFNFMNATIHIDNESTICIVKNPVFHSKAKHIEIRHHFIRDSYKKKLIQVIKIHTDHNVADLLIKAFDASRKAKRTTKISQFSGPIHLVADETVYKEWKDRMERATTTTSSLEVE
ncbi:putative ribonuclease H-like domain-containing protein [Tanacetum coccineum]